MGTNVVLPLSHEGHHHSPPPRMFSVCIVLLGQQWLRLRITQFAFSYRQLCRRGTATPSGRCRHTRIASPSPPAPPGTACPAKAGSPSQREGARPKSSKARRQSLHIGSVMYSYPLGLCFRTKKRKKSKTKNTWSVTLFAVVLRIVIE
jgi:hypothetical protein